MRSTIKLITAGLTLSALALGTLPGAAAGYPDHPVKIVVPFAPAGPTDVMARLIAQKLSDSLKQQFYIENHPGAGGNIGMTQVAKSPPDGYTILVASSSYVVNPSLYAKNPYDPFKDFAPVTLAAASPNILVVHSDFPAKSVKDLVDLIKKNPGKYNYAMPGTGTTPHLAGELFKLTAKINIVHVPYRGAAPAVNDLLAQQVQMVFLDLPVLLPQIKAGKLKPIAVGAPQRVPSAPDVPTTAEAGMPNLLTENWYGMVAPAKTPPNIVAVLNKAAVEAMKDPAVIEKLSSQGAILSGDSPEHFAAFIDSEIKKWAKVIKDAGVQTSK